MNETKDFIPFRIAKIVTETLGVKTFHLTTETAISFRTGQFLTFIINLGGKQYRRSYSLITLPGEGFAITVRKIDNGIFSRRLVEDTEVGDVLYAIRPAGTFTVPDTGLYRQVFFFAAGIGITPVYALIKDLLTTRPDLTLVLVYSNRSKAVTIFYNQLQLLAQQYPEQLTIEYLFSNIQDLGHARLNKELLPKIVASCSTVPMQEQLFYMCGPMAYMCMVGYALEESGYTASQMKREIFETQLPVSKIAPADKAKHSVTISLYGVAQTIEVQYPETILSVAKKHRIPLLYSCEAGKCGSCTMHCTEGEVWMSYNEILTPRELDEGKILTCTGFPVNGDVKITTD